MRGIRLWILNSLDVFVGLVRVFRVQKFLFLKRRFKILDTKGTNEVENHEHAFDSFFELRKFDPVQGLTNFSNQPLNSSSMLTPHERTSA